MYAFPYSVWSFADLLNLATDVFFLTECYLNFRTGVTVCVSAAPG